MNIPNIDMVASMDAFKMSVKKDYPFFEDLVINSCKRMDEVGSRMMKFIRLQEDKIRKGLAPKINTTILIGMSSLWPNDPTNQNRTPNLIIIGFMHLRMMERKMNFPRSLIIIFYGCFRYDLYDARSRRQSKVAKERRKVQRLKG